MSDVIRQSEIAAEQRHVDRVYARVDDLRAEAQERYRAGYGISRARTPGSLVERDAMVFHAARRLRALDAEYEGLVFGRLDLQGGETRHVGRLGLRDAAQEPLVIDWRAPGAAPFYQATAQEPMQVIRRRVIQCAGPKVLDIEDDLLDLAAVTDNDAGDGASGDTDDRAGATVTVVGEGALLATLARAKGSRMRDIVTTIMREQDTAIRAPASGVTLIEGGPGTGKTAVALHRAAHLLYRDRRRFEGGGVLLVGPSDLFMSYVERVLPSLGEDAAELRALGSIVDGLSADRLDPPELAAIKGSLHMRRFLQRALRAGPPDAPTDLRIMYRARLLRVSGGDLERVRRDMYARVSQHNTGGPEIRRGLVRALWADRPHDVAWTTKDFAREIYDRDEFERFARVWWPMLTPMDVLGWLRDVTRVRQAGQNWLSAAECEALAASWAGGPDDLSVADVALADELRHLLGEPPTPSRPGRRGRDLGVDAAGDDLRELSTVSDRYYAAPRRQARPDNYDGYAHVLVDEAQDISPMQWRMLGRRGRQASWTIVGDAAQSAWPDPAESRQARDEALRGKQIRRFHLSTNYRNSAEIFDFAASVVRPAVPDADLPRAVRRTGAVPRHQRVGQTGWAAAVRDAVVRTLAEVAGTVGVIVPAARRETVAGWLTELDPPGQKSTDSDRRVYVVDGMRAKGMEYDGVVIVAPDEIVAESSSGVRVLYVALTRATHRLTTVTDDDSWYAVSP